MTKSKYDLYRKIICSGEIPPKIIVEMIRGECTAKRICAARHRRTDDLIKNRNSYRNCKKLERSVDAIYRKRVRSSEKAREMQ